MERDRMRGGLRGEEMEGEVDFSQFISRYLVVREPH